MSETQQIEAYLLGALSPEDRLLMEARLIVEEDLRVKLNWQKNTYFIIKNYGRNQLRLEIEKVHARLFSEKKFGWFKVKINNIFK